LKVKVIGQSSRSWEENVAKVVGATSSESLLVVVSAKVFRETPPSGTVIVSSGRKYIFLSDSFHHIGLLPNAMDFTAT